jgi:hypothetical protein
MRLLRLIKLATSAPQGDQVAPGLRIRKAAIVDAAESPDGEAHGRVESVALCGGKSVISFESHSQRSQRCCAPEES